MTSSAVCSQPPYRSREKQLQEVTVTVLHRNVTSADVTAVQQRLSIASVSLRALWSWQTSIGLELAAWDCTVASGTRAHWTVGSFGRASGAGPQGEPPTKAKRPQAARDGLEKPGVGATYGVLRTESRQHERTYERSAHDDEDGPHFAQVTRSKFQQRPCQIRTIRSRFKARGCCDAVGLYQRRLIIRWQCC